MTEKEIFINQMKSRTKRLALETIAFCNSLPRNRTCFRIGDQLLRSGTSVGANYRAACRSGSKAEFFSKISIVIEESDESAFWLELLIESKEQDNSKAQDLMCEFNEITSILAKARKSLSIK